VYVSTIIFYEPLSAGVEERVLSRMRGKPVGTPMVTIASSATIGTSGSIADTASGAQPLRAHMRTNEVAREDWILSYVPSVTFRDILS